MQNFLNDNPEQHLAPQHNAAVQVFAQKTARRRPYVRIALGVVGLVLLVAVGVSVFAASRLAQAFARSKEASAAAQDALREGDVAAADAALGKASAAIADAKSGLALIGFLRIVPWLGTQVRGLSYTLDAGEATVGALREAVGIVVAVSDVTEEAQALVRVTDGDVPYGELSHSARVALLEALHDAHPDLLQMQITLALAQDDLDRLEDLHVAPALSRAVAPFADLVTPLARAVDLLTPFAAVIPDLAGLGEDRQFLLLFANNTELRPAGGFLGVYGLALTRDGEIVGLSTDDVYALDGAVPADYTVVPPLPLTNYLGATTWFFRDGNWSPDFPTATQDTVQLMRQEYAAAGEPVPEVHGVLMLTPTFIGQLLDLLGPVTVDDQTFTSVNIAEKLEYQVELGYAEQGLPSHQRKDIVARMTDGVVDRLLALPTNDWPELFAVLSDGFTEKNIALWSPDADVQAVYADAGWSGEVSLGTADDVLMVVDANLAALKTDPVVARSIAYSLEKGDDGYVGKVAVTYTNEGTFTWKTTRYRTYTRVYVPEGSTLLSSSGALANDKLQNPSGAEGTVTVTDELGMTSFGAFIAIEPGESRTLTFTYALPQSVADAVAKGTYELRVIKQLGAAAHDLSLALDFSREVVYATPSEEEDAWHDDAYTVDTTLDTDKTFVIGLAQ